MKQYRKCDLARTLGIDSSNLRYYLTQGWIPNQIVYDEKQVKQIEKWIKAYLTPPKPLVFE